MNAVVSKKNVVVFVLVAVLNTACSSEVQLPVGAKLIVSPETYTVKAIGTLDEDEICNYDQALYQDIPLLYQMTTEDGVPIGGVPFSLLVEYAGNSFSGEPRLSLFADVNSNGVVDEDSELISGEANPIATIKTDRWNGSASLILRVNLSCEFTGSVFAYSGGTHTQSIISVVETATGSTSTTTE